MAQRRRPPIVSGRLVKLPGDAPSQGGPAKPPQPEASPALLRHLDRLMWKLFHDKGGNNNG